MPSTRCSPRTGRPSRVRARAHERVPGRCSVPGMAEAPDPDAFALERSEVREGVSIAYVRAGVGGYPLLLVHGWPETKRIWWRNIAALADAGFEVIAPDLRGYGDSDLAPDGFYDVTAYSLDLYTLVHDVLGHERCAVAGGDLGGVILYDLALRYPG